MFEKILETNLINFLIVISTLVYISKRAKLGDLIDKMAQEIKNNVEKSAQSAKNALQEYKTTKKSLSNLSKIQEEILEGARLNAQVQKEKIEQKTKTQLKEIKDGLEKLIQTRTEGFKKYTIDEIYQICVNLARKETEKRLDFDFKKKLLNISIEELDKIEGTLL